MLQNHHVSPSQVSKYKNNFVDEIEKLKLKAEKEAEN